MGNNKRIIIVSRQATFSEVGVCESTVCAHKVSEKPVVPCTFNGKITEDKIKYLQHLVTCKHNLLYKEIYMQK